jgi:hypothetical protein
MSWTRRVRPAMRNFVSVHYHAMMHVFCWMKARVVFFSGTGFSSSSILRNSLLILQLLPNLNWLEPSTKL